MKKLPVHSRLGRVRWRGRVGHDLHNAALSDGVLAPRRFMTAAVAMTVSGQRALQARPCLRNSPAIPRASMVSAVLGHGVGRDALNHFRVGV